MKINKFYVRYLLLSGACLMFMGMGDATQKPLRAPLSGENYTVEVIDIDGNSYRASRFSCEGQTYFEAEYGRTKIIIPFSKLVSVTLLPAQSGSKNKVQAQIELDDGNVVSTVMNALSRCYGESDFAFYEIKIENIRQVIF